MDLYRRIARVRTQEEGDDITDELIDRYGDPPVGVANLIAIALLRARARRPGHHRVGAEGGQPALLPPPARLCQGGGGVRPGKVQGPPPLFRRRQAYLSLRLKKGDDVLKLAGIVLRDFEAAG